MHQFGIQEINTHNNQPSIIMRGENQTHYDLVSKNKRLDRVRYNTFYEHLECYFTNKDVHLVKGVTFSKFPTITVCRSLIDGSFKISWLTISESLLNQLSWSVEGLNIFMLNDGLPQCLIDIIQSLEELQMEVIGKQGSLKQGSIILQPSLQNLGITQVNCNIEYTTQSIKSSIEIKKYTPKFSTLMQHPRLSKEKRNQIKKVFKF